MKTIVTGAAGFIGSHVAKHLLEMGHDVLAIDDLSGGCIDNVPVGAKFVGISINENLDEIFMKFRPDIVYHLAAYAAEGLSHHIPTFNYQNNIMGTVNVLNAARKSSCSHFVFTSSIAAYGHPINGLPFKESDTCNPCDPYGIAKLACENHIKSVVNYYNDINFTIFRPHNVFGPNQNISDPYRNVVGIFMSRIIQGLPLPIFGDGSQTRSFSFINVVAESIAMAPFIEAARNKTFNIGGDENMSVYELAKELASIFEVNPDIQWLPQRKEVDHAHCIHDLAKSTFVESYTNFISIKDGLKIMADSLKGKPIPAFTECPAEIEFFELLPQSWVERLKQRK